MPSAAGQPPSGPLCGLRVVEMAGIGPAPYAAMLMGDLGADVLRLDRPGGEVNGLGTPTRYDFNRRSRRSVALDLKRPDAVAVALRLVAGADMLIEGYRPGVMERLGLGPEPCLARNPRLVYGRVTGWGQEGPLATTAGHDLTYLARSGVLAAIGTAERPVPPLNLIGDFAGGSAFLLIGLLAALHHAQRTGEGQVVDAAMIDGASSLLTMMHGLRAAGAWETRRAANTLDGGAPFYDVYACADGRFVAVAPLEPKFFAVLGRAIGLTEGEIAGQWDRATWPALRARMAAIFAARTRDDWAARLVDSDACLAPVLDMAEAASDPAAAARDAFVTVDGLAQPAPAPRFSRTPGAIRSAPPEPGQGAGDALRDWGWSEDEIDALRAAGTLAGDP